jgi:hypothetical protein
MARIASPEAKRVRVGEAAREEASADRTSVASSEGGLTNTGSSSSSWEAATASSSESEARKGYGKDAGDTKMEGGWSEKEG